jgi:RNA processing factor Prp31
MACLSVDERENRRKYHSPYQTKLVEAYETKFPELRELTDSGDMSVWGVTHMLTAEGIEEFDKEFPKVLEKATSGSEFVRQYSEMFQKLARKYKNRIAW